VAPLSDLPDRLQTLKEVFVLAGRHRALHTVVAAKEEHRGTWLLRLSDVADRTAAEALREGVLLVKESELPPLPEGEYYIHDLLGLQVSTVAGRQLGPITDVLETGANDVYVTAGGLIPAIAQVVKKVDLAAGTMLIDPLPGMLDEAEA